MRSGARGKAIGLVAFGALIGAGSYVALDHSVPRKTAISDVFYASCREAIQAGAAPLHRGDPGYAAHLDADNDGIACEPYRPR